MSGEELRRILGLQGEKLEVGGQEVTVRPLVLAQFAEALEVLDRLADRGLVDRGDGRRDFSVQKMALRGGRDFIDLLEICTRLDRETLDGLRLDDAARLAEAVWRQNSGFFLRNREAFEAIVLPAIEAAKRYAGNLLTRVLSFVYEQMVTASKTSADTPSTSSAVSSGTPSTGSGPGAVV